MIWISIFSFSHETPDPQALTIFIAQKGVTWRSSHKIDDLLKIPVVKQGFVLELSESNLRILTSEERQCTLEKILNKPGFIHLAENILAHKDAEFLSENLGIWNKI